MSYYIAGFAGSLRKGSFNKNVLNFVAERENDVYIHPFDELPLFNADLESGGDPVQVKRWKDQIKQADGLFIVTPEYSHAMPGVAKNALDWAGSIANENVLDKKPVMIIGASPTGMGTGFAQAQMRQVLAACGAYVMPQPEVFIGRVHNIMDENGRLTDQGTVDFLADAINEFRSFIAMCQQ
ncbi:NADPH-dependent FMN reductase [Salisediminibacterium halotolerans]|uniref:NADPH-dependent FMN reductase n=1 Tax=Salisediminibacterium halotolerans TaxID=517425 RepID=UPI000EAEB003|nr:NADPH-dependent FMN reductase [Salisediminibacterium halotolerans]RLJ74430.1 chromate reductase [Actinophytocola xinjiangensis]RPE87477.1 chromate reductase [Salisediminibacterium halotolerans]TWG35266.1 chromate reductase [Salisediminibacterium halotolerans]GEL06747.1 FMN reductase [Salisediminibacterium halotolerans]